MPALNSRLVDPRPFPDVILKSQFFDLAGNHVLTSEQRLMLAVLTDAINVLREGNRSAGRKRSYAAEARNWIFRSGVRCPLSFECVCDALRIDAGALRWRLRSIASANRNAANPRLHLQLKESSRVHRMTLNRIRRRERRQAHPATDLG